MLFNEHRVLGQVVLGYSPMVDRHRAITAIRLTVFPSRPDVAPNALALLEAVAEVWPADGGRVSLNVISESLLHELMSSRPAPNLMVEIPAFMACDSENAASLQAMRAHGSTLLIKGRPLSPVPREVLPCFAYSIVDLADERRDGMPAPDGVARTVPHIQSGVRTLADMELAFQRDAVAVLGWPMDDMATVAASAGIRPETQIVIDLIKRVDRDEPVERLDEMLGSDPALASRLMHYLNSAAAGSSAAASSLREAITATGSRRLNRWLVLLLASTSPDPDMKPLMYAAVRRGLLMEELARQTADVERRDEVFICGVFSLLDRILGQPLERLSRVLAVPDAVRAALADQSGPHFANLELVRAVESESVYDIRAAAETAMVALPELNRAVLRALAAAKRFD